MKRLEKYSELISLPPRTEHHGLLKKGVVLRIEWSWLQHRTLVGTFFQGLGLCRLLNLLLLSSWSGIPDGFDHVLTTSSFLLVLPLKDVTGLTVLTENGLSSTVFDAQEQCCLVDGESVFLNLLDKLSTKLNEGRVTM